MKNLLLILALFISCALSAQINTPAPSPNCTFKQKVGLTDITLEYSRPSVKNRTIYAADGLVPYGKLWRTGANRVTKITFGDDVKVDGKELKAGTYAMLTTPGADVWDVHFYAHESNSWSSYKEKAPNVSVQTKPYVLPEGVHIETFLIDIANVTDNSADIELVWSNVVVGVPIEVEVDSRVMADIEKTMGGPGAGDHYTAASYYYKTDRDLEKALEWIQVATHVDEPRFWQVRREAEILAKLGRYKEAIEVAEKSKELAKKAENADFIKINNQNIKKWSTM
jgi:hypothetical protein